MQLIGIDKNELDTPALLIDLDLLEKNLKTMGDYYKGKKGAALRPHQKGHRLPIIAKKQIDCGAKGVSMTSLGLAEYYVACGISDILITNEIAGKNKLKRVCTLSNHADITVGVDNIENAQHLGVIARECGTTVNVAVELYMGTGTCGVDIMQAKSFIEELCKIKGITFKGLWWHQGSLADIIDFEERKKAHFETLDKVAALKNEIEAAGIGVDMVSGGFTCTWNITPEYPRLDNVEVQAGSYPFSDWCSHESEGLEVFDYALTVLTRCISRPKPDEVLFDAGMNACSDEHTDSYLNVVGFKLKGFEGITRVKQREELSMVKFEHPTKEIQVGDAVELIPPHSDTTAKLYDRYYCIRNGKVEAVWPNYGRGLL
ncbi:MAG: alanine racemase [Theionarchaea archaeon]|nr:alanine racemase [Theionarchaea archaeon]